VSGAAPEKIGKYEIRKELGRGATSRVLLGHDPFARQDVAIKVFFNEAGVDEDTRKMRELAFVTEAALVGTLNHPHIIAIYDAATEPDFRYIVMEYAPGGTLEQFCDPARLLPVYRVLEMVFKCARALDVAFHAGVIHRDMKPANILLDDKGDICITDFGAALTARQEGAKNFNTMVLARQQVDAVVGSPAFMSPEQLLGEPLNQQADIYSLGVVMYQLLTGKLPFNAPNAMALAAAVVNTPPAPPSQQRKDIPAEVEAIVMRALEKDRAKRYPRWADMCKDLSKAFEAHKEEAPSTTDTEKFEALRTLPFFGDFEDAALWEALKVATWHEFPDGATILREGEGGNSLYVLIDGQLDVSVQGKEVGKIRRGDCFGEMSYFAKSSAAAKRNSTVSARHACDAIEMPAPALRKASDRLQAALVSAVMQVLIARINQANQRMVVMSA
jgi:serine/threonine protein kinase